MAKWTLPKTPDMIPRAEAEAMVAAALREAAGVLFTTELKVPLSMVGYMDDFCGRVNYAILALIDNDTGAALDRALAAAEARGMEKAAEIAEHGKIQVAGVIIHGKQYRAAIAAAIRALAEENERLRKRVEAADILAGCVGPLLELDKGIGTRSTVHDICEETLAAYRATEERT